MALTSIANSNPVILGILISVKIRSIFSCLKTSNPSNPSFAVKTFPNILFKDLRKVFLVTSSSST